MILIVSFKACHNCLLSDLLENNARANCQASTMQFASSQAAALIGGIHSRILGRSVFGPPELGTLFAQNPFLRKTSWQAAGPTASLSR